MSSTDPSAPDYRRPIAGYAPSATWAGVGTGLWGVLAMILWCHFFLRTPKRPRYMLTLNIGVTAMTLGFALRFPLTVDNDPYSLGVGIIVILFTLLSPCLFLATDYILLPRLARSIDCADCLIIRPERYLKIFVWSDVVTFWLQAAGGGMSAAGGNMASIGQKLALVGLVLQTVSFGIFTMSWAMFGYRVNTRYPNVWRNLFYANTQRSTSNVSAYDPRHPPSQHIPLQNKDSPELVFEQRLENDKTKWSHDWRVLFWALGVTCVGILIRSVFRVIEYSQGYVGYLSTHEWAFLTFDSLPLFIAVCLYAIVWPAPIVERERGHAADSSPSVV